MSPRPLTLAFAVAVILATPAVWAGGGSTTIRGAGASGYALRMPMKRLKQHVRNGTLSARGMPAMILNTRLFVHKLFGGKVPQSFGARLKAALDQPVSSVMEHSGVITVPVYAKGSKTPAQRPKSAAKVTDQTTALVTALRQAKDSPARSALLGKHAAARFDRNAFGRLLRAHRGHHGKGDPIIFATGAFKAQPRNGGNTLVASGGGEVYMAMQKPKTLTSKGKLAFVIIGGQPGTANMGPTAGSKVYFEVDRKGKIVDIEVIGRGDLLLREVSSQLAADIKANKRTGSLADPRDLLALVNHAAPSLLARMVKAPKPAHLFSEMKDWVPFAKDKK